jgi:hypothetical protein
MSEISEALLAVTGVIRPRPDDESIGKAAELLEDFRARIRRWIASSTVKPWSPPLAHGFSTREGLRERIMYTPDEPDGVHDLGDDVLAAEWTEELKDARAQLLAAWPGVVMRGGLEAEEVPLSFDRGQDWLGLVGVVEDPFRLLLELESGAVLPAQLALFESVYPELARILTEETFAALVDLQVKSRELPPAKDRVVRLVLKVPPESPILVPKPEEPPPEKPKKSGEQDTRTVAQKAAT